MSLHASRRGQCTMRHALQRPARTDIYPDPSYLRPEALTGSIYVITSRALTGYWLVTDWLWPGYGYGMAWLRVWHGLVTGTNPDIWHGPNLRLLAKLTRLGSNCVLGVD